ncbi:MAG: bifunctional homocysteine S-methyltransferase/methylenetetrahydrofolate reductase [Pirellulales bacterium]|nr:bifunctional homocysteine S-methyltransferase/methylenetetrahydrofolate reductase [Pirellulales bacterium]
MPDRTPFSEVFGRQTLVFDGAMGTEIYRRHVLTNRCYDELCLSEPKLIHEILAAYRDAGVDVVTTNTFGANRAALARFGLGDQAARINRAGAQIAREVADAADRPVYVAGDVGPMPSQPEHQPHVEEMIVQQVDALLEGGADFILFETTPTRAAMERIALAMRARADVPYVLSFAILDNGETVAGESLDRMLAPLPEGTPPPLGLGMNCGTGPSTLLAAAQRAVGLAQFPLLVMPNAGVPKEVDSRRIYLCSPEYVASYAMRYVRLGVAAVGGCCGIGPEHMREVVKTVKATARATVHVALQPAEPAEPAQAPAPLAEKSAWGRRLAEGQWVTSVELLPPRGYDLTAIVAKSRALAERGVWAINVPDGPRASSRISSLVTCERIRREAGIEPILHFCCRDRNLIGMQADLLACAACEIHNILFVTGDPPKLGNYPQATGVFDTDSIGMVGLQQRLNRGLDLGGQAIDPKTLAVIGVGLDPTALDQDRELDRFRRKIDAGAEFAITQPVFDTDALLRFLDRLPANPIPIVAGVWPLASYRNATFLHNEVPGVTIPEAILARMAAVEDREAQLAMGVTIAREAVERIRSRVAGIQVSAPFGKIETALAVIEGP